LLREKLSAHDKIAIKNAKKREKMDIEEIFREFSSLGVEFATK